MNATEPVKSMVVGLRWSAPRSEAGIRSARRERPEAVAGPRQDPRKMPNGDPPPATLWGTDPGE